MEENIFTKTLRDIEKIYIKDTFIHALWNAQLLEQNLKILLSLCILQTKKNNTISKLDYSPQKDKLTLPLGRIHDKLKIFFTNPLHKEFNEQVRKAINKRNKFIHEVFLISSKNYKFINFDTKNITTHKEAKNILDEWINISLKINIILSDYILKYSEGLGKINIIDLI